MGELPILLLMLVAGVIADRHDRRRILLMSQVVQMSAAFTLAALVYWDIVEIWHVLALSTVTGFAQAFGGPAYQSLLPALVGRDDVPNAIAFNSIQFNLARFVGPPLAGATLALFGMVACFGLNGLSFLFVIAAILSLHVRHTPPAREIRAGFLGFFDFVALRNDDDAFRFSAETVRQNNRSANKLVGFSRINSEPHRQFDRFIKLGKSDFFYFTDRFVQSIFLLRLDLFHRRKIFLASFHCVLRCKRNVFKFAFQNA
jgi:MFS family permease